MLIREKRIPIVNLDLYKPSEVVGKINESCANYVTQNTHTDAWKYFKVRPENGSSTPEACKTDYCVYDSAHNDYLYTQAWVQKCVTELSSPDRFEEITGRKPEQNDR